MKTRSQGSSIPEEIPEEYVNDTFESLDSSATPAHSTPVRSDLTLKRDTSPALSRRSSTGEGSKSEEDTSMTGELYSIVSSRGKTTAKTRFPIGNSHERLAGLLLLRSLLQDYHKNSIHSTLSYVINSRQRCICACLSCCGGAATTVNLNVFKSKKSKSK